MYLCPFVSRVLRQCQLTGDKEYMMTLEGTCHALNDAETVATRTKGMGNVKSGAVAEL